MDKIAATTSEQKAKGKEEKSKSILIVEDDNLLRSTMTRFLKRMGYEVQSVANGFEGLLLLQYKRPDLIITDIRMPKLGGLSMAEGLKNRPETKDIPIILITAYRDESYYARAHNVGAHYFLLKPFTLTELQEKVEAVFKRLKK